MNGFADHGLDDSAFGEKKGLSENIRTFDAFRKTPTNQTHFGSILQKHVKLCYDLFSLISPAALPPQDSSNGAF